MHERAASVLDIGCGDGAIAKACASAGMRVVAIDGRLPSAHAVQRTPSGGVVEFLRMDLARTFPEELGTYDWTMSFAAAEHVPFQFEHILVTNLQRTAASGLLLVWDNRLAEGTGHVNCRDEPEVLRIFGALGFDVDEDATVTLRASASLRWYRLVLVLRRRAVERPQMVVGMPLNGEPLHCKKAIAASETCVVEHWQRLHRSSDTVLTTTGVSCYGTGFDHWACCATERDYSMTIAPQYLLV
uniref:2-polyprenyl-3-methyl-5-hydroxy-6-metoxy-1, 4-benzoquinol methylase-like protein n=1 Tax=Pfiesteria piscicida TaxID=71001 RepID=A3E3D7_PFIPI|nr:2-polyprenyl-3-methyl-5-hydroxy-6-metoxy-1,4-benzoquinol methylase-like protein [Pfiesteria piscicida]